MALDVTIGNINPGSVRTEFVISSIKARDAGANFCIIAVTGYLDDGRNNVVKEFITNTTQSWLLFIDSDIEYKVEDIERLIASADPEERPVVTGVYFSTVGEPKEPGGPWRQLPLIYFWDEDHTKMSPVDEHWLAGKVGVHECDGAGAGFLLIHRKFLEKMAVEYASRSSLPWFDEPMKNGVHFGEDLAFLMRVKEMGYKFYVNVDVRVAHHKTVRMAG